jgi:hypothetical protein
MDSHNMSWSFEFVINGCHGISGPTPASPGMSGAHPKLSLPKAHVGIDCHKYLEIPEPKCRGCVVKCPILDIHRYPTKAASNMGGRVNFMANYIKRVADKNWLAHELTQPSSTQYGTVPWILWTGVERPIQDQWRWLGNGMKQGICWIRTK